MLHVSCTSTATMGWRITLRHCCSYYLSQALNIARDGSPLASALSDA